jgi:hypothetical protein
MSTITNSKHRRLIQDLEAKSGVTFASTGHTKNGHLRLVLDNGAIVIASGTGSDRRVVMNIVGDIRRASARNSA